MTLKELDHLIASPEVTVDAVSYRHDVSATTAVAAGPKNAVAVP